MKGKDFWTYIIIGVIGLVGWNIYSNSDEAMFNKAKSKSTIEYYDAYVSKHPDGKHIREAGDYIIRQYSNTDITGNNMSGYGVDKLENARDGYSVSYIRELFNDLISKKVDEQYNKANRMGTAEAWTAYMNSLPIDYWKDAPQKKEEIENRRKWGSEWSAWNTASSMGTREGYEKYLSLYPYGSHAGAADKKLIDIEVSSIFAGSHGTLPSMDKTSYGYGSSSTISVSNDTQYQLTLLYSGPESRRLVLAPHASRSITLPNGNYRIAASVNTGGVSSYAGTESLTGGGYDISYYISTTRF